MEMTGCNCYYINNRFHTGQQLMLSGSKCVAQFARWKTINTQIHITYIYVMYIYIKYIYFFINIYLYIIFIYACFVGLETG